MEIHPNFELIPENYIEIEKIKEFMPKPFGDHTEKDFNILHHVRLKEVVKKTEEELTAAAKKKKKDDSENGGVVADDDIDEDDGEGIVPDENRTYDRRIIPTITERWLRVSPDRESVIQDLLRCIAEGTNSIQAFERWSRHDDMTM